MREPVFSVVIPLYNKELSIGATLASALAQKDVAFEVVVVDDGSTDRSAEIVAAVADPRLRLIRQANQGASAARNRGVAEARGVFAAFLDGDDLWDSDFLATISTLVALFPDAGVYATAYRVDAGQGRVRPVQLHPALAARGPGLMPDYFSAATFGEQPFYTSSTCVRCTAFLASGGFAVGVTHGEDLDQWARLALANPIAFTPEAKVTYRTGAENRAMRRFPALKAWCFRPAGRAVLAARTLPEEELRALKEHMARVDVYTAMANLANPDGKSVRGFLQQVETQAFATKKLLMLAFLHLPLPLRRAILAARADLRT